MTPEERKEFMQKRIKAFRQRQLDRKNRYDSMSKFSQMKYRWKHRDPHCSELNAGESDADYQMFINNDDMIKLDEWFYTYIIPYRVWRNCRVNY